LTAEIIDTSAIAQRNVERASLDPLQFW
jgi:hypothetical protein